MERDDIRMFENMRRIFSQIYKYGFYSREQFIESGCFSDRAYDQIIRLLRDLYYTDVDEKTSPLHGDTAGRGKFKCYQFKRDHFVSAGDYLAAAYGVFSVKDRVLAGLLYSLSLASKPNGTTVAELDRTFIDSDQGTDSRSNFTRYTRALANDGYIIRKKTRKTVDLFLNRALAGLSEKELISLYYLSAFFAGAGYPRVPAVQLREALKREFYFRHLPAPPDAFFFRENTCGNLFDEQIVYQLLQCCRDKQEIAIRPIKDSFPSLTVQPVYLKIDNKLGRWYLFCFSGEQALIQRVSRIRDVRPTGRHFDYEQAKKAVEQGLFNSYISGRNRDKPVRVEAELHFEGFNYRDQFEREIRIGWIEQRGDREVYCADVNDPLELKPLLRSYGPYLKILPGEGHNLGEEIHAEYERMLNQYGSV